MEKLIELLNEYEELTDAEECEKRYIDEYDRISEWWRRAQWTNTWICSKKFGFIKWLVDNDKIDRVEVWSTWMTKPTYWYTTEPYTTCKSIKLENTILMVLAIQDEPLTFLISILR